jgi:selenocysteine lyase/cysteine desulfurase
MLSQILKRKTASRDRRDSHNRKDLFLTAYPSYPQTTRLDKLRQTEYAGLDRNHHIYLDYTGGNLYASSQLEKHQALLRENVFGNPHSTNPTSQTATRLVEETRKKVLDFFNAGDDYFCIFTQNASGAMKIVGECYPFGPGSFLLLSLDNHNSANGIREFAHNKRAEFAYTPLEKDTLYIDKTVLMENLDRHHEKNRLFIYPAQSNVSGIRHPLEFVQAAHDKGWDVLLDTAAYVPTSKLDLQQVKPDFAPVSFYKIFGYPTGIGCLLVRKDKFDKLKKPWYAGGTISLAADIYPAHYLLHSHERFEDGTLNYLGIPAVGIGIDHIRAIGMDMIHTRVQCLTGWALRELSSLKHSNGNPIVRISGTADTLQRGGTIVMNFYDREGILYPFGMIESAANKQNISIRTGCFCNPGIDETTNHITYDDLFRYFSTHKEGNFYDMIDVIGKLRGSVRISFGLVTNFNDVEAFIDFAVGFRDKGLMD